MPSNSVSLSKVRSATSRYGRGPCAAKQAGRPIASVPGFAYSDSLKSVGGNWTFEALNVMVNNPKKEASGTKMTFPGLPKEQDRADVIAYLQSLK